MFLIGRVRQLQREFLHTTRILAAVRAVAFQCGLMSYDGYILVRASVVSPGTPALRIPTLPLGARPEKLGRGPDRDHRERIVSMRTQCRRGLAICMLALAVALLLLVILAPRMIVGFLGTYQSSHSIVAQRSAMTILVFVVSIVGLLSAAGIVLLLRPIRPRRLLQWLLLADANTRIDCFRKDLRWLVASSALAVLLIGLYLLQPLLSEFSVVRFLYGEDGFFETLTAILAFGAGALYGGIALRVKRSISPEECRHIKVVQTLLTLAAAACVLFALEEISWGQRVFGWQTPSSLLGANYQGETNLHNLLGTLPKLLNWGLTAYCVLTVLSWLGGVRRRIPWVGLLFPHPCFVLLVYLGLFATGEIQEQLVVMLLVFHTLRSLRCQLSTPRLSHR